MATPGTLLDLNVSVSGTHTWVGDLTFTNGCSSDHLDPTVDDEGVDGPVENQCRTSPPALFGNPTPNNPLSVFDGLSLNGNWSLQVRDSASGDTGVLQQWCLSPALAQPAITLQKTVGTDPAVCASGSNISVPYGADVYYCYSVTNTGGAPATLHNLTDDRLGTILNNFSYTLNPGTSAFLTQSATLTQTTVNTAQWFASNGVYTATATAQATVTVSAPPTIDTSPINLASAQPVNVLANRTITVSNIGGANLAWNVTAHNGPSCASPLGLAWAGVTPSNGTTAPATQVPLQVTFDSTGLTANTTRTGTLCFTSNDPNSPQVAVPLTLQVEPFKVYLPLVLR